jgi:hypothetical protein
MNGFHESALRLAQIVDPCVLCVIVMFVYRKEIWVVESVARCGGVQGCDVGEVNGCEILSRIASCRVALPVTSHVYGALLFCLYGRRLRARCSLCHRCPSAGAAVSDLGR